MLVKFFINEKLFVFHAKEFTTTWHHVISVDVMKQCEFVSLGTIIVKARSPNKYLMERDIVAMYNNGDYKELPVSRLASSDLSSLVISNLGYKYDDSLYTYSAPLLYKIFDELYEMPTYKY